MAKMIVPWGKSRVDAVTREFFEKVGIDPTYVIEYSITRSLDDKGTIVVKMWFDDKPAPAGEE